MGQVTADSAPLSPSSAWSVQVRDVHRGWPIDRRRVVRLGHEPDEIGLDPSTRTHVFDVSDVDADMVIRGQLHRRTEGSTIRRSRGSRDRGDGVFRYLVRAGGNRARRRLERSRVTALRRDHGQRHGQWTAPTDETERTRDRRSRLEDRQATSACGAIEGSSARRLP